jgi:hypothetical protein
VLKACPTSAFTETDPNLEIRPREPEPGVIVDGQPRDRATDKPANPNNTLTYTVNLTRCLAVPTDAGPGPEPWNPGETKGVDFGAGDASGAASLLGIFFRRQ